MVEYLIDNQADVSATTKDNNTALHLIAKYKWWDIRKEDGKKYQIGQLLIAKGVDINAVNVHKQTALECALLIENDIILKLLLEHSAIIPNNILCCKVEDQSLLKVLIDHRANVNGTDNNGWTPLHWAMKYNDDDMARKLIANKADVNAVSERGGRPIHHAVANLSTSKTQLLIQNNADINVIDGTDMTPIYTALCSPSTQINKLIQILLDNGANPGIKCKRYTCEKWMQEGITKIIHNCQLTWSPVNHCWITNSLQKAQVFGLLLIRNTRFLPNEIMFLIFQLLINYDPDF